MANPFEQLCPELIAQIFHYLPVPEQILSGTGICAQFRDAHLKHGPVSVLRQQLQNVRNVPVFGRLEWRPRDDLYEGLTLNMTTADRRRNAHMCVNAELPVTFGHQSPGVFFRFKMRDLRPNGGYCSLFLASQNGNRGHFEIKFDTSVLRGYGSQVTAEDFERRTDTVRASEWLHLHVQFDWNAQTVKLSVDGVLIKTLQLNDNGWDGIHSVLLKGYNFHPMGDYLQAWSHIYVERKID
jgi:hypothetical protein